MRVRLRILTRTRRGWKVRTLGTFPSSGDAIAWLHTAGGATGREWIERRQAPASLEVQR